MSKFETCPLASGKKCYKEPTLTDKRCYMWPNCYIEDDEEDLRDVKNVDLPCGHVLCVPCLSQHMQDDVEKKERTRIICKDSSGCGEEIPYSLIEKAYQEFKKTGYCAKGAKSEDGQKVCSLSLKEYEHKIEINFIKDLGFLTTCPKCQGNGIAQLFEYRVTCHFKNGNARCDTEFCSTCGKKWKKKSSSRCDTKCGNFGCESHAETYRETMGALKDIPTTKVQKVEGVPARVCPRPSCLNRGPYLVQHRKKCKHLTCKQCFKDFCCICLAVKEDNKWPRSCGSYNTSCTVAPVQTFEGSFKK